MDSGVAGLVAGSPEAEGAARQAEGKVQKGIGKMKEAARDAANRVERDIREREKKEKEKKDKAA